MFHIKSQACLCSPGSSFLFVSKENIYALSILPLYATRSVHLIILESTTLVMFSHEWVCSTNRLVTYFSLLLPRQEDIGVLEFACYMIQVIFIVVVSPVTFILIIVLLLLFSFPLSLLSSRSLLFFSVNTVANTNNIYTVVIYLTSLGQSCTSSSKAQSFAKFPKSCAL
jgi:hypothetical protein